MAMTQMTPAAKVAKLRKMAEDKSLPQDVRNQYLDEAVKIEEKAAKGAGVKMAKGGAVVAKAPAKAAPKKMMYGGAVKPMAEKPMMAKGGDAKKMMMGGAVAKELPKRGQRTATNMAKGGAAMKAKKK
jgi:hypothetical protein